jgi:hypothetical protein|tara:strand:+ start:3031 stop:3219 length:189 start_codon:yes stop_codon:yes gene_type:complete
MSYKNIVKKQIEAAEKAGGFSLASISINSDLGIQFISIMMQSVVESSVTKQPKKSMNWHKHE